MERLIVVLKGIGIAVLFAASVVLLKKLLIEPVFSRIFRGNLSKILQAATSIIIQLILFYVLSRFLIRLEFFGDAPVVNLLKGSGMAATILFLAVIFLAVMKVMTLNAPKSLDASGFLERFLTAVVFFLVLALFEEIAFRGILYTVLRNTFTAPVTIGITTVAFLLLHLGNGSIGVFAILSIALGGLVLNLMREFSNGIWMPLGFHFAWNLLQGSAGFNVSGDNEIEPLLNVRLHGPKILTGGRFGLEASIITITLLVILALLLIRWQQALK